jgi:hypothetical protein
MTIVILIGVCLVLVVLAFLMPRLSSYPQRGVDRTLSAGARGAGKAPGRLGRWLAKPFTKSEQAADKSAAAGRKGRAKAPF